MLKKDVFFKNFLNFYSIKNLAVVNEVNIKIRKSKTSQKRGAEASPPPMLLKCFEIFSSFPKFSLAPSKLERLNTASQFPPVTLL